MNSYTREEIKNAFKQWTQEEYENPSDHENRYNGDVNNLDDHAEDCTAHLIKIIQHQKSKHSHKGA